jgi:hypothetical protein
MPLADEQRRGLREVFFLRGGMRFVLKGGNFVPLSYGYQRRYLRQNSV